MKKIIHIALTVIMVILLAVTITGTKAETDGIVEIPGNRVTVMLSLNGSTVNGSAYIMKAPGLTSSTWLKIQHQTDVGTWVVVSAVHDSSNYLTTSATATSGVYRARVTTYFYDSTGTLVDTITKYSSTIIK